MIKANWFLKIEYFKSTCNDNDVWSKVPKCVTGKIQRVLIIIINIII